MIFLFLFLLICLNEISRSISGGIYKTDNLRASMGSKAPASWAYQWGTREDYDGKLSSQVGHGSSSKMDGVKSAASAGLFKAKAAAVVGAQKVKTGTSLGFRWVKNHYQKRVSK